MTRLRERRTAKMKPHLWLLMLLQLSGVCSSSSDVALMQLSAAGGLPHAIDRVRRDGMYYPMLEDTGAAGTADSATQRQAFVPIAVDALDTAPSYHRGALTDSSDLYFERSSLPPAFTLRDYTPTAQVVEAGSNYDSQITVPLQTSRAMNTVTQPRAAYNGTNSTSSYNGTKTQYDDDEEEVIIEVETTMEILIPEEYLLGELGQPWMQQGYSNVQPINQPHLAPLVTANIHPPTLSPYPQYPLPLTPATPAIGNYPLQLYPQITYPVGQHHLPFSTPSMAHPVTPGVYPPLSWKPRFPPLGNYWSQPYSPNYYRAHHLQPAVPFSHKNPYVSPFTAAGQLTHYGIPSKRYRPPIPGVNSHIRNPSSTAFSGGRYFPTVAPKYRTPSKFLPTVKTPVTSGPPLTQTPISSTPGKLPLQPHSPVPNRGDFQPILPSSSINPYVPPLPTENQYPQPISALGTHIKKTTYAPHKSRFSRSVDTQKSTFPLSPFPLPPCYLPLPLPAVPPFTPPTPAPPLVAPVPSYYPVGPLPQYTPTINIPHIPETYSPSELATARDTPTPVPAPTDRYLAPPPPVYPTFPTTNYLPPPIPFHYPGEPLVPHPSILDEMLPQHPALPFPTAPLPPIVPLHHNLPPLPFPMAPFIPPVDINEDEIYFPVQYNLPPLPFERAPLRPTVPLPLPRAPLAPAVPLNHPPLPFRTAPIRPNVPLNRPPLPFRTAPIRPTVPLNRPPLPFRTAPIRPTVPLNRPPVPFRTAPIRPTVPLNLLPLPFRTPPFTPPLDYNLPPLPLTTDPLSPPVVSDDKIYFPSDHDLLPLPFPTESVHPNEEIYIPLKNNARTIEFQTAPLREFVPSPMMPPVAHPPIATPLIPPHSFGENSLPVHPPTKPLARPEEENVEASAASPLSNPPVQSPVQRTPIGFPPLPPEPPKIFRTPYPVAPPPTPFPATPLDSPPHASEYLQDFPVAGVVPPMYNWLFADPPPLSESKLLPLRQKILTDSEIRATHLDPCSSLLNANGCLPPVIVLLTCEGASKVLSDLPGLIREGVATVLH